MEYYYRYARGTLTQAVTTLTWSINFSVVYFRYVAVMLDGMLGGAQRCDLSLQVCQCTFSTLEEGH